MFFLVIIEAVFYTYCIMTNLLFHLVASYRHLICDPGKLNQYSVDQELHL